MKVRDLLRAVFALLILSFGACALAAYPEQAIRLIVGYPPGGGADIVARMLAPEIGKTLGTTVYVENRPGANGSISNDLVAAAKPDGYTLLLTNLDAQVYNPLIYPSNGGDPQRTLVPVALLTSTPFVIVVSASSEFTSLPDLMRRANEKPKTVTYGSAGPGSLEHLFGAILETATNTQMVHVPFKGTAPALIDLLANRIDFIAEGRSSTISYIAAGKLRALAVTGASRMADLPAVPTVRETGVADVDFAPWMGVVAPAKTPMDILTRLNAAFDAALRTPAIQDALAKLGTNPAPSTIERFTERLARDSAVAQKLVKETKLKVD